MTSTKRDYVTFMFTDIQGSTRLWEEHDRAMESALSLHDEIFHGAVKACEGRVFKHTGDGLAAVFPEVRCAARAALQAQQLMASSDWGKIGELRSRIGIHTGPAQARSGEYFGRDVNRCARIMDVAHGGQVLVSESTATLLESIDPNTWLIRDLGVHQLKDLSEPERVFQLSHPELPSRFPPLRSIERIPRQLPALAELFVGRTDEIQQLGKLLRKARLISLTGPGGVGKTQLAIAAAIDYLREFPDGAWFCPMVNVTSIAEIAELIESTMGLHATTGADAITRLTSGLANRRALLILDGVEQILVATKQLVATLLDACQNVIVICTSREVLHSRLEQVLAIGPLEVPDLEADTIATARQSASVELFERRARLADSAFELCADNLAGVVSICRQLDGLPLAVELAAAQMAALHPQDLADRFGLRVGLIDDRDQTLSTVIDWSYSSLSERERMLFQRLAVFAGGFSLALAERVCVDDRITLDDVMPSLADLVNKSVISIQRTLDGNRYIMLGLLRSYAMNHLVNADDIDEQRQRHLDAYLDFAAKAKAGLNTHSEADWVKRITMEFANLRAAFSWAIESGQLGRAFELIHYSDAFGRERFRREIDSWSEEALRTASGEEAYLFAAKAVLATAAARRDDIAGACQLADEALECARRSSATDTFIAYRLVAITGILTGDRERTDRASDEAIRRATEQQRPLEMARFKSMKAHGALFSPDTADAIELANAALTQARGLRNPSLLAWCLYVAGLLETEENRAIALLEESIEFADMVHNRYIAGLALQVSMWKRQSVGQQEVASACRRVITHWYRVANWAALAISLRICAQAMHETNDELVAVIAGWLGRDDSRIAFSAGTNDPYTQVITSVTQRMGEDAFQTTAYRGATMEAAEIVTYCESALRNQSP